MMKESCNFPLPFGLSIVQPTRPERRDAAEHRRRILETAQRLFAEHGVNAVSMHQIALAAGVGQGTLYRRYAHKGKLCMDLLRDHHEQLVDKLAKGFTTNAKASRLERLDGVLTHIVAFLEEQGALLEPIVATEREAMCAPSENTHVFAPQQMSFYLWLHELFASLLSAAVEQGELEPLDVSYTADAILAALNPMVYRFQRQERGFSQERILQGLHRIYVEGIRTPHSAVEMAEGKSIVSK
jgi:AcrR family transcriptional regulator